MVVPAVFGSVSPPPATTAPVREPGAGGVSGRGDALDLEEAVHEDRGRPVHVGAVGELGAAVGAPTMDRLVLEERARVGPADDDLAGGDAEPLDVDGRGAV